VLKRAVISGSSFDGTKEPSLFEGISQQIEAVMKKTLFNAFLFIPFMIFGCFDGTFSGKSDKIFIQEEINTKLDHKSLAILNKYGNTIRTYSERYGVDWRLVVAVIKVESRFDHSAESYKGAKGFMQIMPATQIHAGGEDGTWTVQHWMIRTAIFRGGVYYLSRLYKQFRKRWIERRKQDQIDPCGI
jgi:hypothetical protein